MPVTDERRCYYLVSAAGHPNYGDELITAAWLRHLAVAAPEAEVWLDCQEPGTAQLLVGDLHPRLRVVDTLWRLCREAPEDEPWRLAAWVQRAVHHPGLAPRLVAGIERLVSADVVHLLGGGYLAGLWPGHIGLVAGAAAAVTAHGEGARAVASGQGLVPVAPGVTPLLAALLRRFDLVDVRDAESAALLTEAGVPQVISTGDDAFLAFADGTGPITDAREHAPEFMVCAQSDASRVEPPRLAAYLLDCLRAWGARPEQVGVVEGVPGADREVYALLEHELPGARFYPFSHLWRDGLPLAAGQRWLSTRFHFHLVAAAAGAGGLGLSVHPAYYDIKHGSLLAAGSGWSMADLDAPPPARPPAPGGFGSAAVRRLATRKSALAAELYPPLRSPLWALGAQRDHRAPSRATAGT